MTELRGRSGNARIDWQATYLETLLSANHAVFDEMVVRSVVIADLVALFGWASDERKRLEWESRPMVPCGMYGCTNPKREGTIMCCDCRLEQASDPDAFK